MILFALLSCAETLSDCEGWSEGERVGVIENDSVDEISGIASSREHSGWLWVHNDSGDTARIFSMRTNGSDGGAWTLASVEVEDLEDIAIDNEGRLVVGDIGDNKRKRDEVRILRMSEPDPSAGGGTITGIESVALSYPDDPQNAEALMVDPTDGEIYVLTKGATSTLFRADLERGEMVEVTTIDPRRWRLDERHDVTAADVTTDGKVLVRMYDHILAWNLADGGLSSTFEGTACRVPHTYEPQGEALGASPTGFHTASEGPGAAVYAYSRR